MLGSKSFAYYIISDGYALEYVIIPNHVENNSGIVLFPLLSVSKTCMYQVYITLLNNRLLGNHVTRNFTSSGNPPDLVHS